MMPLPRINRLNSLISRCLPRTLADRVFGLFALSLLVFLIVALKLFYNYQFHERVDDVQGQSEVVANITAQAIAESVVIGDYDAVRRAMGRALVRTPFAKAQFIDLKGGRITLNARPDSGNMLTAAPGFLESRLAERLYDVNENLVVGGRDYGVLRFSYNVSRIASEIWRLTLAAVALAGVSLLVGLVTLRLVMNRWLSGLGRLGQVEKQVISGEIPQQDWDLADAPLEIRQAMQTVSRTAASLRDQFGQRIDQLMHALVQQKNALDQTAIVHEIDRDHRVAAVNDLFCARMGRKRSDCVGLPFAVFAGQADQAALMLGAQPWNGILHLQGPGGTPLYLRRTVVPILDASQSIEKWICIDIDITRQKQAEDELTETIRRSKELAERQLKALLDTVGSDGFALFDRNDRLVLCNERFRQLYDLAGERLGLRFDDILTNALRTDPLLVSNHLSAHQMASGVPQIMPFGPDRWLRLVEQPTGDGGLVGIYSDVSDQVRLEQELRRSRDLAEAGNRSKSEFLATMSHEIRTPMNGIIGMTSLLLDTTLNGEQRQYANTVRTSAESLLSIINDILDFSKIEAGRMELEVTPFGLLSLVEGVVDILAPRVAGSSVDLVYQVPTAAGGMYLGDGGRLRQVLLNLVGNAIKFTEKGAVAIAVTNQPGVDGRDMVRFVVTDTGVGVPEDAKSRLFGVFTQADASTSRRFGGTGLGLAICKRIVELMGGEIGFDSRLGQGSRFWFQVPLRRADAVPNPLTSQALKGRHILLVDDQPACRRLFTDLLEQWGAVVTSCDQALSALTILRQHQLMTATGASGNGKPPVSVLLLDHHMPGMHGLDLAAIVRIDPTLDQLRLVLMSAGDTVLLETALQQQQIDQVVAKPVRLRALLQALTGAPDPGDLEQDFSGRDAPCRPVTPGQLVPAGGGGLRILVAEDNAINQQVATGLLGKLGHRCDVADDGVQAVALVERGDYDLILMDMQMPNMDGLKATRMIRAMPSAKKDVIIIAMTANAMAHDREACLDAGMNDFLAKPIDRQRLRQIVDRWSTRLREGGAAVAGGDASGGV